MGDLVRNGNSERVLGAVKQGVSDPKAIATWLGIDKQAVDNALKRLVDGKKVRRDSSTRYVPNERPLLADVWR